MLVSPTAALVSHADPLTTGIEGPSPRIDQPMNRVGPVVVIVNHSTDYQSMPHLPDTCACLASTLATCRYARLTLYIDPPDPPVEPGALSQQQPAQQPLMAQPPGSTSWLDTLAQHDGSTTVAQPLRGTTLLERHHGTTRWNNMMEQQEGTTSVITIPATTVSGGFQNNSRNAHDS